MSVAEGVEAFFAIDAEVGAVAFGFEILAQEHTEVFVVFTKEDVDVFNSFFHSCPGF